MDGGGSPGPQGVQPPEEVKEVRRWLLVVAYNGAPFRGFAYQPGVSTVAGTLSTALARALHLDEPPLLTCAGRTDAGVHARGQVVHADLPWPFPTRHRGKTVSEMTGGDLARAVNRQTAPDVVVRDAGLAPEGFDARRSATSRRYRYLVWNAPDPDPLLDAVCWHVPQPLELRAMRAASDALEGSHDFRAFCRRPPAAPPDRPIIRRVRRASWSELPGPERFLRFDIEADSFCHQMVRSLVAMLVDVGKGRESVAGIVGRLRTGDRSGTPRPAPPGGLCLVAVSYAGSGAMLEGRP